MGDAVAKRLPACLIIMDGFGLADAGEGNAISQADTPVLDEVFASYPWTRLAASGEAVGLPEGQMGNSEVGHLNIGAGRVVYQELTRINAACADGSIAANPVLQEAFAGVRERGGVLHLMGLLSDGGVHSSNAHLYALLRAAVASGVERVFVHCFMDGRDVPPESGLGFVRALEAGIEAIEREGAGADAGAGAAADGGARGASPGVRCRIEIASISGRYYAMDRDKRWDRVQKAYDTIACAANFTDLSPATAMQQSYDAGVTDEFVVPVAFDRRGMQDGDAVVFFNFRPDRAREITRALIDDGFDGFERACRPRVDFVCLTEYDPALAAPVAFAKEFPPHVLADALAEAGLSQYHIAETEKYAHVTFFLNGGVEEPVRGEQRTLIPSPNVATYDLQPEMSAPEVASTLAQAIREDAADVYIVNFANCDMVGHTGVIPAAVAAVEAVDAGVGAVLEAMAEKQGVVLLTADHGNADKMLAADGTPFTAHTTALVPLVLIDYSGSGFALTERTGKLSDIAPTLLRMIGLQPPEEMSGECLLA